MELHVLFESDEKMEFRNYAAQACRDLREFCMVFDPIRQRDDLASVTGLVNQIEKSVHFAIPDFGRIFDDQFKGLHDLELRLPFPSVTLEYFVPDDKGVDKSTSIYSPKRLVLACEVDAERPETMVWLNEHVRQEIYDGFKNRALHPRPRGILVWGASSLPWERGSSELHFSPEHCMWLLPDRYLPEEDIDLDDVRKVGKGREGSKNPYSGVILGRDILAMRDSIVASVRNGAFGGRDLAEVRASLSTDIAQEAAVVLEFVEASSCSNIHHVIGQAAPKPSVAAKRKKNGKLPIFETRVLAIDVPDKTVTQNPSGGLGQGSRSGPRQHLRRGHIRRLESGKRIWVQSAVIGAGSVKGNVQKNYVVNVK